MSWIKRFWDKVEVSAGCWEWTGGYTGSGYGEFSLDGGPVNAHRVAYMLGYGDIPDGMCVCLHCDNPRCVRLSHLFLGTHGDNARDSAVKGRRAKGEKNGNSRLTESDIYEIRRLRLLGVTQDFLAKMWRISQSHVHNIVYRKDWKHI